MAQKFNAKRGKSHNCTCVYSKEHVWMALEPISLTLTDNSCSFTLDVEGIPSTVENGRLISITPHIT